MYLNHRQLDDDPTIRSEEGVALQRGRLGDRIQEMVDAGWRWTIQFAIPDGVAAQATKGSWPDGTYQQVGGTDSADVEYAVMRAHRVWREYLKDNTDHEQ